MKSHSQVPTLENQSVFRKTPLRESDALTTPRQHLGGSACQPPALQMRIVNIQQKGRSLEETWPEPKNLDKPNLIQVHRQRYTRAIAACSSYKSFENPPLTLLLEQ